MIIFKDIHPAHSDYHSLKHLQDLKLLNLRKADIEELKAQHPGISPFRALLMCAINSKDWTRIAYNREGRPIAVFGLSHDATGCGVPWMFGSDAFDSMSVKKDLLIFGKLVVAAMLCFYPVLHNYVDSRNKAHIRYLKHLGFYFPKVPNHEILINGVRFLYFRKEADYV